jgi:hypothetical protein
MARYDKYGPRTGGFRAPVAAAVLAADLSKPFAVGLDANGRVVKGAGTSGILGIMVNTKAKAVGDIVDVMTAGEIVEATLSDGTTPLTAGARVWGIGATGLLALATAVGSKPIGYAVEASRLVVRVGVQAAE